MHQTCTAYNNAGSYLLPCERPEGHAGLHGAIKWNLRETAHVEHRWAEKFDAPTARIIPDMFA